MGFEQAKESELVVPGLAGISRGRSSLKPVWFSVWWMLLLMALLPGQFVSGQGTELKTELKTQLKTSSDSAEVVQEDLDNDSGDVAKAKSTTGLPESESTERIGDQSLRNRLISYTFFGALLLVFLALLFGYLRLDHATRGFHSGRLQIAALALCAIVLAVGYLLWTQVLFK